MRKIKTIDMFNFILYIFLLFPFFKITYFVSNFSKAELVYKILQIIATMIILFLVLKKGKYSKIINYILFYLLVFILATFLNKGELSGSFFLSLRTLVLCLIVDYGLRNNTKIFLSAFEVLLSIFVYANFMSIVIFRNGMYTNEIGYTENWILGYKNLHILYILPALLGSFLSSYYSKNRLSFKNYLLLSISFLSLLTVNSSTSLVGVILILFYLLFYNLINKVNLFNIKNYFLIYIVLFMSIVILRIQNLFKFLIVDILHKDLTLTGRTYIWDYVIRLIKQKKFLGYGLENSSLRLNKTTYWRSYHAHDQLLEIIYKTGIIGLILYFIIMYKSFKELYQYRDFKIAKFMAIIIFSYCIMMLTEFYLFDTYIFIFVFAYNIKYLLKGGEKNEAIN